MPTLVELANTYNVSSQRPFFPVNSLRLLYFIISDHFTQDNEETREKIGALIPTVEAVFAARTANRENNPKATIADDLLAVEKPLADVYQVIDTPLTRQVFGQLLTYIYPLQDDLFVDTYQEYVGETPLTATNLRSLLRIRAMDSLVFSTLVGEVIDQHRVAQTDTNSAASQMDKYRLQQALDYHIHQSYQLNDLVDAIVFAKDDLEAENFSPFQFVRKIAPEPSAAKELIKNLLTDFTENLKILPFPSPIQESVTMFYEELARVVQSS